MSSSTIVDRLSDLLAASAPFDVLTEDTRQDLLSDVSIEYYGAGEKIIDQGATAHPGLFIVESGMVRLMDVVSQRLVGKVGEGEHFGSFGLIKGGAAIYEAKAVEPTVAAVLHAERFQTLYDQHEAFAAHFDGEIRLYMRRIGSTLDVSGAHVLFNRSLSQFVHRPLVSCPHSTSCRAAAAQMDRYGVDAIVVTRGEKPVGIATNTDLRRLIASASTGPEAAVGTIMSTPAVTIGTDASVFDAMMMMLSNGLRHLVMVDPEQARCPVGVLTDRDVSHVRGQDPVATLGRIDHALSTDELAAMRTSTHEHLLNLYRQGAMPEMLNRIMMLLYDRLVLRVLTLVESTLRDAPDAEPVDLSWAWIRLGSGGRREMALNSAQHNALVYAEPRDDAERARADAWFNRLAEGVNDALTACGFTPSEYVARDPRWRKSVREWKRTFREWVLEADEASLSSTPIFFDLRCVFGDATLVEVLKEDLTDALNVQAMDESRTFLRLLAAHAVEFRAPAGLLRNVLDRMGEGRHTIDVRDDGIRPIVDAARVLALENRYVESTNTFDRLRTIAGEMDDLTATVDDALEAYQYLVDFRLESQLKAVEAGDPPVNHIEATTLNKMQQRLLRDAFSRAADLQNVLVRRYRLGRKWRSRDQLGP